MLLLKKYNISLLDKNQVSLCLCKLNFMKYVFILILLVPNLLKGQISKAFKIIGHSTFYNNQNLIIQAGVTVEYYDYNDLDFEKNKADTFNISGRLRKVQHEQFKVNGILQYPHPFLISYYDAETSMINNSDFFFVDEGTSYINVNKLYTNNHVVNVLNSTSEKEYQQLKKLYSNSVDTVSKVIHDFKTKQKIIVKYITQHPNSYVALWDLVIDYVILRYYKKEDDKKTLLKILDNFSPKIKKIKTYQALVDNINQDLKLTSGEMFPNITLTSKYNDADLSGGKIFPDFPLNASASLLAVVKKNKFTLLDFWFSYCEPCIKQLPDLKSIYNNYKDKHFEIIGISVDSKENEGNWEKVIQQFNLKWLQYLDKKKDISQELNITYFPTNFLLDNNGKIIRKDISPQDLNDFLKNHLN